ncbi:hypothetical protein [Brumimicrobium oceani]|uniref:Outer membrane protein beta-barrel domain-containing protein n=1 Tax=Brumimicrobium oceani TaxID=2100725 RepID=A0A2U2XF03_9FLAO|nr:hypothetical protein [Brumimicrobium oceani]PWH86379.1 hypothetical protein DIT68_03820 [Brumimicrobium oceani]
MGNKIAILIISTFFALISNFSQAQYSLGGGISSFHGLNLDINRMGLNGFVELPKANDITLMVRAAYMFPVKDSRTADIEAKNFNIKPAKSEADIVAKTSYFAVDGGTRHYFINDYDVGFSLFAGPHIKGILASYSVDYRVPSGLNPSDYQTIATGSAPAQDLNSLRPQYSLLFAFGGTVGVKYQLPYRGALMFDFGLEIVTQLYDPAYILGYDISPLSFSMNLGYRFDWY